MKEKSLNELTQHDSKAIKGMAILFMVSLHLFCRRDNLPYNCILYIKNTPLVYYLGLWGDQCVALYCFCAGYASYIKQEQCEKDIYVRHSVKRMVKLMINYWIVLILFCIIGMITGKSAIMPGSVIKFISNFFLLSNSYNGAWWYMLTYMLLMIISPVMYRIIKEKNNALVFAGTGALYFISYLIRFDIVKVMSGGIIFDWLIRQGALVGTSLLPYVVGMIFKKNMFISQLRRLRKHFSKYEINLFTIVIFGICILTHGYEQSPIIAPIYAVVTICVFSLWQGKIKKLLKNIGEHSTNIWLTHMFFYLFLFEGFIYKFKYPMIIYVVMLGLCLLVSYIINFLLVNIITRIKILN